MFARLGAARAKQTNSRGTSSMADSTSNGTSKSKTQAKRATTEAKKSAGKTASATKTAAAKTVTAQKNQAQVGAEPAVDIPVGVAPTVSDRIGDFVEPLTSRTKAQKQLKSYRT